MKLYAEMINLGRAKDRRDHMTAELQSAGISADFFPAFDYTEHSDEETLSYCRPDGPWGVFPKPNMAATISHAQAWERFLASDATHCLIMEDDIFISPELREWLNDFSWWPEDADIVKLERWRSENQFVLLENLGHADHLGRQIRSVLSRHMGAAGYLLSRSAAKKLLASRPFGMVVDHILFNVNASAVSKKFRIYQIQPALVVQGNEPPNATFYMGERQRPKGKALLKQKLKRGYYELAYSPRTILKALSGKARTARISYASTVLKPQPDSSER